MKYKNFREDSWKKFNEEINGKIVFLWGLEGAKKTIKNIRKYNANWNIKGIIDNDEKKTNKSLFDVYNIFLPVELEKYDLDDIVVLITSRYVGPISLQLEEMGIKNYWSEYWMDCEHRNYHTEVIPPDIVNKLKEILYDDKSKSILDEIVYKRRNGIIDYTNITEWKKSEYFSDEFWNPCAEGEIFIDGGAYTGDTIEEFVNWTHNKYRHIYSFEPQKDKARLIEKNMFKYDRVSFFEKGLWSSETELSFCDGDEFYSGKIVDNDNNNKISTITIDDVLDGREATFIKMDIEGAETEALIGARKTILKYKPKLAICIYHKSTDLYEIPFYINKLVPEYKMFIRHVGLGGFGTILYAYI
ncbi:FkbM family methyltransferase [Eubacterium sp. MSJ-13]|uniref:FkbM family methyltransferase n=1 Tax=Eubacterium sp. MSJ-13 TaxID=2841513 RepID=UPI001C121DA9|nr:FkbM family methyltransferase [Eubacterium sp. MSJ-13]MBU5477607.1 FkbM family methyltransferase [Eubacterium sp. MSJ-13]